MNAWDWYVRALKKYATFQGRARRSEYWFFMLISALVSIGFGVADTIIGTSFRWLYNLGTIIPFLAVTTRRLHDSGRSGWRQLLWLIPLLGWVPLIAFLASDSEASENEYGRLPTA